MRLSLLPLILVIAAVGCSSKIAPTEQAEEQAAEKITVNRELTGDVSIDGSSTVYPISEAAAAQFQKRYPNVGVTVGQSGTGGGFKRFTKGETDISDASRSIKQEEFESARQSGAAFVEMPIAFDGLTIVVHPKNDWVDQITVDELKKIFTAEGQAKNWSDVREGWPEKEIAIFAPGTDSGTFDYFNEVVAGEDGQMRSDMSTSEDDNVLVTGVSGSPEAIGFFGVAYYEENKDKLRAVPVVNPQSGEAVLPNPETIESGEYAPFSRPLFIYVNADSLRRPEVKRFAQFYLEQAPELAAETGYVALPASVYDQVRTNLQSRKTGTHYLTEEGESRSGPVTEVYAPENLHSF
ncbi:PstS family phosphate ABC transporter substrate-binding protein [Candidatus Laterigemmans baculatus]|uniref:PstS family phosphate ABC transporter substrate-binding protein n=1 Tax=Candidatus Laterigemmans baculatus TaxID=2770505 RepID=UPI0013DA9D89|nr:PstS family phosphate ABC transporter substrate-binding protein [Candidatus Laterigemmans baculatus]